MDDTSGILEDGEVEEKQNAVGSLHGEFQLSNYRYSALQNRYKRLEHQHGELQDLASAYSDVIKGFSPSGSQTVSIDQLLAEAGRDGLRTKALEADAIRPLIREAGGLQALISQLNVTRVLVEKAGGLRELEQFVSDLCTIRDTLDIVRGSRGLAGLTTEVRGLFQSKQKYDGLAIEVDGPNGLRDKAAKYEKLAQAFANLQATCTFQIPSAGNAAMNPDRARMISATPLEADPHRDLYEAPPPIAKPSNKTGSNNTPLGASQEQPPESSLKRKGLENPASRIPAKHSRIEVGRASAPLQVSLPATRSSCTDQIAGPKNPLGKHAGTAGVKTWAQAVSVHVTDFHQGQSDTMNKGGKIPLPEAQFDLSRADGRIAKTGMVNSGTQVQTTSLPPKMPDWMRSDIRFRDTIFAPTTEGPRYTFIPPAQDVECHADATLAPVRCSMANPSLPAYSSQMPGSVGEMQTASQSMAAVPVARHPNQLTIWNDHFWVGASGANAVWDAHQLHDVKRGSQVPSDVRACLTGELSRLIAIAKYSTYEAMVPNQGTCILGYLIDGHAPSGLPQERTACRLCTQHRRPCALLQEIDGSRIVIFMPLRAELRAGLRWSEKAFWIQDVQKG